MRCREEGVKQNVSYLLDLKNEKKERMGIGTQDDLQQVQKCRLQLIVGLESGKGENFALGLG